MVTFVREDDIVKIKQTGIIVYLLFNLCILDELYWKSFSWYLIQYVEHRRQTVMLQVLTENLINAVLVTWMYFNINFGKFCWIYCNNNKIVCFFLRIKMKKQKQ